VCCSVWQCVAVCCSVLQCVAVCCSVWQSVAASLPIQYGLVMLIFLFNVHESYLSIQLNFLFNMDEFAIFFLL